MNLYDAGALVGVAEVDASSGGQFAITTSNLSSGAHDLNAVWSNSAGSQTSVSNDIVVTIDNTPGTIGMNGVSVAKSGHFDKVTLGGGASDGADFSVQVDVFRDGVHVGATTSQAGGWSYVDGQASISTHRYTVQVTDDAGNIATSGQTVVVGTTGSETITGTMASEVIYGAGGVDTLIGGGGNDTFVYNLASDSAYSMIKGRLATPDTIQDYTTGDHLDLSGMGHLMFGGETQTMTANHVDWYQSGGDTYVFADVNGDARPDFIVKLVGLHTMSASDFVLG